MVDTIGWHVDQMWVNIWGNTGLTYQLCISGHVDQHWLHLDWHARQTRLYQHMTNTLQDTQLTLSWYLIHARLTLLSLSGLLLLSSIFFTSPSKLFFVSPLHNGKGIRDGCHSSKTTVNNTHIPPTVHHAIQCCMLDWYAANCWSHCNSQSLAKCWPSCQPSIKQL